MERKATHKFIPAAHFHARTKNRAISTPMAHLPTEKAILPPKASLRGQVPEIYDQGELGSCTANAFCAAYRLLCADKTFKPSRLWVYFYERLAEDPRHRVSDLTDSGADVIDGEKYVQQHGVCSEALWPYNISKYNHRPTKKCTQDALHHKLSSYGRITADQIKQSIASGTPVLIAIEVYSSFESAETAKNGQVAMPNTQTEELLGGHELCLVGYDDTTKTFEVQNSWGDSWGDKGFCHIPYDYIQNGNLCPELTVFKI